MKKNGIASNTENKKNDSNLKKPSNSPRANDIPSKMLLLQMLPIPTTVKPARPNDNTPIRAALRFCLYMTRVCPSMSLQSSPTLLSVLLCLPEFSAVGGYYILKKHRTRVVISSMHIRHRQTPYSNKTNLNLILCPDMQWHKANT